MKNRIIGLILPALLIASCGGSVATSATPSPTVAVATATALATATSAATPTAPAAASSAGVSPVFGPSECTSPTATTRQVIERYLALSTSNNAQAVSDCFAKVWRDKTSSFAEGAAVWSKSGPATNVSMNFMDAVNGCDRFGVNAQMSNPPNAAFKVPPFFSVGPEGGRMRIYETSTALTNANATTLRCP